MKLIYFLDMVTVQYMSLAANELMRGTGHVERIEFATRTGLAASRFLALAAAVSVNTAHDEHMSRVRAQ